MNMEHAPIMAMMATNDMPAGSGLFGRGPWGATRPHGTPGDRYAAISPAYWLGAIALGAVIWVAVIRLI